MLEFQQRGDKSRRQTHPIEQKASTDMLNEPSSRKERKPHPLERRPPETPAPEAQEERASRRAILHIPTVKPYLTYALIVLNGLIFLIGFANPEINSMLLSAGANNRALVINGDYYRLITAMFLHANMTHIAFNMFSLYIFGVAVESQFGHFRFALVYFLGGIGGSVASIVFSNAFSVGASGAVFAVFGAQLIFIYQHRKLLGAAGKRMLQNMIIVAALNFAIGLVSTLNLGGAVIDNWAHLGGFVGGMVLTWFIGPIYLLVRHPEHPNELLAQDLRAIKHNYQSVFFYVTVLLVVLIVQTLFYQG